MQKRGQIQQLYTLLCKLAMTPFLVNPESVRTLAMRIDEEVAKRGVKQLDWFSRVRRYVEDGMQVP